jgi:hypothetical protein
MDIRLDFPELIEICAAVTGPAHIGIAGGSIPAVVPYFIWNGSNWALNSSSVTDMQFITCGIGASSTSAAAPQSSTRTRSHGKITLRYGAHG